MSLPPNTTIILGGRPVPLRWDKAALFRADDIGLFDTKKPGIGLATGAKYIWCMLPDAERGRFPTPLEVAVAMPATAEAWAVINNAINAGQEDTSPKKAAGSTSGRSPSSS